MKNAFSGYTYQHQVTYLLLTIMDVDRKINKLEIEAATTDNFDDLIVFTDSESFQLQIKDFENISLQDLKIEGNEISIKAKKHKLSNHQNIIFFKHISINPNDTFLGFKSQRLNNNVTIISLSRTEIDNKITSIYQNNSQRKNEIIAFFNSVLDNRIWSIPVESLPQLRIFITALQEASVAISHKILEFENLLLIEGKLGIGKSHLVNTLMTEYKNSVVYRFWIGNQDQDYQDRLKFTNFIRDLNYKTFYDQKEREIEDLFSKLLKTKATLIIDGLDHVENYNSVDFTLFIDFINKVKVYCKVIVLSRPLAKDPAWQKHKLENWSLTQTQKVLNKLFHISKYSTVDEIYNISKGYPIIVKYLAEHYRIYKEVPKIDQVDTIDNYYGALIQNEKGLSGLSVFLCCSSYLMKSEIELFLGNETEYVNEFINEHPYLFDIKLNRVSLFHDSFNTFLKKKINYKFKSERIAQTVSDSILKYEKGFISRFSLFQLSPLQKKQIVIKYSSIKSFKTILKDSIDYESVASFYRQIREELIQFTPMLLSINSYYDLCLIFNLIIRDHISTNNKFYYTYVQSLITNGLTDEDITSSDYLFGMYYYIKTKDAVLIFNKTSEDLYGVEHFYNELENDIFGEQNYISKHSKRLDKRTIDRALNDPLKFRDNITFIIENIFIHQLKINGYEILKSAFETYIDGNKDGAAYNLEIFLIKFNVPEYYASWILNDVYNNLLSYGYSIDNRRNEYHDLSLRELIDKYKDLGSFKLQTKIHNHIRLSLLENKPTDIHNIYTYWTKFYQRKDYTLYGVPVALKSLHGKNFISLYDCVKLINNIQEVSEKGYRHLLSEFIQLFHPSKIIRFLEENFVIKELRIEWFKLPKKYIDLISERTFNFERDELFRYHQRSSIPLEEIENVLYSNKFKNLEFSLNLYRSKIHYKSSQLKTVLKFSGSKIQFEKIEDQHESREKKQNSRQRFQSGILTIQDLNFIRNSITSPHVLAKYSDGNYTSLPDMEIFKPYSIAQINKDFKNIIFYSLTGKTRGSSYFYSIYYHPGNILVMLEKYRSDKEYLRAVKAFQQFMNLSMFELTLNNGS